MMSDKLREVSELRAKIAALESEIAAARRQELATLPAKYGFDSTDEFIVAVRDACGSSGKRRGRPPGTKAKPRKRQRATITDETRAIVKQLAEKGKTRREIADVTGISLPSVQNIKKALGSREGPTLILHRCRIQSPATAGHFCVRKTSSAKYLFRQ